MKHIQTFESFVYDESINEAAIPGGRASKYKSYKVELSPASLKAVQEPYNKASLKSLSDFKFKSKDNEFYFVGLFGWGNETVAWIDNALRGQNQRGNPYCHYQFNDKNGIPITGTIYFNNDTKGIAYKQSNNDLAITVGLDLAKGFYFSNNSDVLKTLELVFAEVGKTGGDEFTKIVDIAKNEIGAYVLAIGVVNIPTGATQYGWSIYDNPNSYVFLVSNRLCYATKDTFKVGDNVEYFGNDNQRKLGTGKVIDFAQCKPDDVINMLYKNGYDYKPKRAFQKADFGRKLDTSYSVKGTFFVHGQK